MGQGPAGEMGRTGDKGPAGPIGPAGPKGQDGIIQWGALTDAQKTEIKDGLKAFAELKGPKGDPGPKGESGDVAWSAFDATQKAQLAGILVANYKADLKGEKGLKGDQGIQGATGPKGDQGTQGIPGNLGDAVALKQALFTEGTTMWCADGDFCQVPVGKNHIKMGTLNFTNKWSGTPDAATGVAEISNDNTNYKTLMIVGNRQQAGANRTIGMWDEVNVNGNLSADKISARGEIIAPAGVNFVHGGSKISDRMGNLHLDTDDWVVFPSGKIKLGKWEIDASDEHLRFRKDGDGQMFVMHNKSWHNGSTWVHGNYHSAQWNKWL